MTIYQFEFRHTSYKHGGPTLVVDIPAPSRADAVKVMRNLVDEWFANDDPHDVRVESDHVYARLWISILPEEISLDNIVDEWEEPCG